MPIEVRERWEGRLVTTDERGVKTFKRQWSVDGQGQTVHEPDAIDSVVAHDATAALYAPHPRYPWAVCRGHTGRPHGGPAVWLVDASYSNAPFAAAGGGSLAVGGPGQVGRGGADLSSLVRQSAQTRADQRPPTISVSRTDVTEPLEFDAVTGARVVNTAGDPFDPVPEVFRSRHVITWKFFRRPEDLDWQNRGVFLDSTNNDWFNVLGRDYPAHSLRCADYSLDTVWETGSAGLALFFALTVQAEYNPAGWKPLRVLNTGRREKDDNPPTKVTAIVDGHGQPVADPVPLTAFGFAAGPNDPLYYVEVNGYVPRDWTHLLA
jgi:hypothetical protein